MFDYDFILKICVVLIGLTWPFRNSPCPLGFESLLRLAEGPCLSFWHFPQRIRRLIFPKTGGMTKPAPSSVGPHVKLHYLFGSSPPPYEQSGLYWSHLFSILTLLTLDQDLDHYWGFFEYGILLDDWLPEYGHDNLSWLELPSSGRYHLTIRVWNGWVTYQRQNCTIYPCCEVTDYLSLPLSCPLTVRNRLLELNLAEKAVQGDISSLEGGKDNNVRTECIIPRFFYHNCYYVETKGMYDLINSYCLLYLAEKELTATCSLSKVQLSDPVNKKNPATKGCPKRYEWESILHNLSGCLLSIKSSISGCIPIPLLEDR